MSEQRTYPSGVPCWIDTERADAQAAAEFYGELFGWTFEDGLPPEVPGSYLVASLDGQPVAGIADGVAVPLERPAAVWNTYIAVDDADTAADAVTAAGGTVVVDPQDAGPAGRYAVCEDPAGAGFRVWKAGYRIGAQVANVPGAWNFNDLRTGDADAALAYYAELFGWESDPPPEGAPARPVRRPGYGDHLAATVDPEIHERQKAVGAPPGFADVIGWLAPLGDEPAPRWNVTFAVADRDASAATVERLGGTVVGTQDTGWTKVAEVRDAEGAPLTLSQFTPPGG